jgi:hypothetical protein
MRGHRQVALVRSRLSLFPLEVSARQAQDGSSRQHHQGSHHALLAKFSKLFCAQTAHVENRSTCAPKKNSGAYTAPAVKMVAVLKAAATDANIDVQFGARL